MVASISTKIDLRKFEKSMRKAPEVAASEMRKAFQRIGQMTTREMSTKRLRGRPGLFRRTGNLVRSQAHEVTGRTLRDLRLVWRIGGETAPYAVIQEFGGVIRPVRAKLLRFQLLPAGGGAARTGIWRSAKEVRIPPRLGFRATWKRLAPRRRKIIREAVRRAIKKATS